MTDSRPSQADAPMLDAAEDDADVDDLSARAQADSAAPDQGDEERAVPTAPAGPADDPADDPAVAGPLNPA